jgi:hypothetical protein
MENHVRASEEKAIVAATVARSVASDEFGC